METHIFGNILQTFVIKSNQLGEFAYVRLAKGEFVDWHIHTEEIEYYYILSGEGIFTNSDKTEQTVTTGDVCTMERNGGHAIRQAGNETLEFIALIIYTD